MNPIVKLTLSNGKSIELELYPDVAPVSVENFLKYIKAGFYNGTFFHRIIRNFMVQGGGFIIDGMTVRQKTPLFPPIFGEFADNGFKNDLKHVPGVLSMARTSDKNSATTQFFICTETDDFLDGNYAAFGKVVNKEGMDAVMALEKSRTMRLDFMSDFPVEPTFITEATVISE